MVGFQFIRPLLSFPGLADPENTGRSIFEGLDLKPWASTSSKLPQQIRDQLLAIFKLLPCFPAYPEAPSVAFAKTSSTGRGPPEFFHRHPTLRLWATEMLCGACGNMHEDKIQWAILLKRAFDILSDKDIDNMAKRPNSYAMSCICPNLACMQTLHNVIEPASVRKQRLACHAKLTGSASKMRDCLTAQNAFEVPTGTSTHSRS